MSVGGRKMVIKNNNITIESTPSGKIIPSWLEHALMADLETDFLVIYPNEASRRDFLSRVSKTNSSIDSSKHLTMKRLTRLLLTDFRQPNVLDDDSTLLSIVHNECCQKAEKGHFPFLHKKGKKWSLSKTERLISLHREISKLPRIPSWETDPGVKEFRKVLKLVEKKSSGIHPDLMRTHLFKVISNPSLSESPFSLKGLDGIIILDHPPEFDEIDRSIFCHLSQKIPIHQLCNPGKYRLGYGGAYLEDVSWCTQDTVPDWVPKHDVIDAEHNAKWQSSISIENTTTYHHVVVERAEHIIDATFNLLHDINVNANSTVMIVDAGLKEREYQWRGRLRKKGFYFPEKEMSLSEVPIIQELTFHLSLAKGLEAWSFERLRRLVNSNHLSITLDNYELEHPTNPEIIPRPHLDILEKISRSFHVLGGPGAANRWLTTLAFTTPSTGYADEEISVKQEETSWWLANIIRLWAPLSEGREIPDEIVGCHTDEKLPLVEIPKDGFQLLEVLIQNIDWEDLMLDDRQFNRCLGALEILKSKCSEIEEISPSTNLDFLEKIKMITSNESGHTSRIECSNVVICEPRESYGLSADIILLVGMDSDSWSMKPRTIPWLDQSTKVKLGLNNSDIRIRSSRHELRHLLNCGNKVVIIDTSLDEAATPSPPLAEWFEEISDNRSVFTEIPDFVNGHSFNQTNPNRAWDLLEQNNIKTLSLRVFSIENSKGSQFGTKSGHRGRDIRQRSGLALSAGKIPERHPNSKSSLAMAMEFSFNNQRYNSQPGINGITVGQSLNWNQREKMISYEKINLRPSLSSANKFTRDNHEWPHLGVKVNGLITSPAIDPRPLPNPTNINQTLLSVIGQSKIGISPKTWSPYRLQSWLKCPRQAWLNDYLKINPTEVPAEDIDNRTRGVLMHDIEAKILSKNGVITFAKPLEFSKPISVSEYGELELLWNVVLEHLKIDSPWLSRKNAVSVHRCREVIGVTPDKWVEYLDGESEIEPSGKIKKYLEASLELTGSAPIACEWKISNNSNGPITIVGKDDSGIEKQFKISGRIDRVDHLYPSSLDENQRLIIIRDMKTVVGPKKGERGNRHRRAIFDELQLAIYAKAWESTFPNDRVVGVGITEVGEDTEYYVEIDPDFKDLVEDINIGTVTTYTSNTYRNLREEKPINSNGFRAWIDERIRTAMRVIQGAETGQINPTISRDCNFCKVRRLCPTSVLGGEN